MKHSRERTILIAVMGVAGVGLLIDRVVIGTGVTGPAESSAGVIDAFDPAAVDPQSLLIDPADSLASAEPRVSFAQRLREAIGAPSNSTEPKQARNAFAAGPGWQAVEMGGPGTTDKNASSLAQDFRSNYNLEAVMDLGDQRYAVIGGQTLPVGQSIDGYKLIAVHERSAIFSKAGIPFEIAIQTAPASL